MWAIIVIIAAGFLGLSVAACLVWAFYRAHKNKSHVNLLLGKKADPYLEGRSFSKLHNVPPAMMQVLIRDRLRRK